MHDSNMIYCRPIIVGADDMHFTRKKDRA